VASARVQVAAAKYSLDDMTTKVTAMNIRAPAGLHRRPKFLGTLVATGVDHEKHGI
jgi:RNA-binding protein YlmH